MPRTTKKTNKRKPVLQKRGPGRPANKVKVEVAGKGVKWGYEPVGDLSPAETRVINLFRQQSGVGAGKKTKPVDIAEKLSVGETFIFTQYSLHGFANSLRRLESEKKMEFNYHEAPFAPGAGLEAQNVLWIKRVK